MRSFLQRHAADVIGVLSGFDRLVFRGTIRRLSIVDGMLLLLNVAHVLFKDFGDYVQGVSSRLKQALTSAMEEAKRPVHYLATSTTSKEQLAREIAQRDDITEGVICLLTCVETCQTFGVRRNREARRLELRPQLRKCLFLYLYQVHPRFGFMHTRIQSWFPFPIQVCLNGREWLAREMDKRGPDYRRRENCFVWLEDVEAAQKLMDAQLRVRWPQLLDELAHQIHPTYRDLFHDFIAPYYWSAAESEWATDVIFRDAPTLARLYPRFLRHGMTTFGSVDVLRFLGRPVPTTGRLHHNFQGEVLTDLRQRPEGVRIRHRLNANAIKLYDKQGNVLRVETTIDRPDDFKVFRRAEGQTEGPCVWRRMRKGIADLARRTQVSHAANERYLEALATASDDTSLADAIRPLCRRVRLGNTVVRALRPWAAEDLQLMRAASRGEFALNGFRNRDLRSLLHPKATGHDRRISARVTRKLRLLRAHGLVRKVPRTHRYVVTTKGRRAITAILAAHTASTEKLLDLAA